MSIKDNDKKQNVSVTVMATKNRINGNTSTYENQSSSVILTSWFTFQKDPQRGKQVAQTINYIWNFYTTSRFLGLKVVIFHDHLPLETTARDN